MTPKENLLEVMKWGNPEYMPMTYECITIGGISTAYDLLNNPMSAKKDCYGVLWTATPEGTLPDNRVAPLLEDITEWRDAITLPNPEDYRKEIYARAAAEEENYDRENKVTELFFPVGLYERLVSFMGYEEALMALVSEPEACGDFFRELSDVYIQFLDILIDAHKPEGVVYLDDMAMARGLFFSLDTFREVFKPHLKKIVDHVHAKGLYFKHHMCGHATDLLDEFIDIGIDGWESAQAVVNDLAAAQKKCQGKLVIEGGWDCSGPCSWVSGTEEQVRAEVRRCMEEYKPGKGFILFPILLNEKGNSAIVGDDRMPALFDEYYKYCRY